MPAGEKPSHNLVLKEEYKTKDGEKKVKWTNLLPIWENGRGMSVRLPKGITLSGTFFIFPNKQRDDSVMADSDPDDDMPF